MVEIEYNDNGKNIKGILLGKYQRLHEETYSCEKKFLWKKKKFYKTKTTNTPLYIIFIPWKHKEKEIVEIDEKYIIHPENIHFEETWVKVDKFISKGYIDGIHHADVEVNNFIGYKFMHENNSFMINLLLDEKWNNLDILYKNMPEILKVDLNNHEEQ